MRFLIVFILIFMSANASGRTSYVIACADTTNQHHMMPLSFYEFNEAFGPFKLEKNFLEELEKISPITFKDFRKTFSRIKLKAEYLGIAWPTHYDSILVVPAECEVMKMTERDYKIPLKMIMDEKFKYLTEDIRTYLIFESMVEYYVKKNLGPFDYRRFSYYMASGQFSKLSTEEKKAFLEYFEIY